MSLEECVNCGVAGWGWQDDGFGAVNKNGVLLRFEPGPQVIVIQTREDGVSVDQIVLSAEKYLTAPPARQRTITRFCRQRRRGSAALLRDAGGTWRLFRPWAA